jgi:lipooligosaccharide transport system permease protein
MAATERLDRLAPPRTGPDGDRVWAAFLAWLHAYRRVWRGSAVNTLLVPVLNLFALGYGLGTLVNPKGGIDGVSYAQFLAPGLLAASAMQTAADEGTWPVMGAVKWNRTYPAMIATPVTSTEVYLGHLAYVLARALSGCAVFAVVLLVAGLAHPSGALLSMPFALLTASAVAAPVMAYAIRAQNDEAFALLYRFVWIPMFLFAGAFFPVSQLPAVLRWVAEVTPLYHGVELVRGAILQTLTWPAAAVHVAYLVVLTAVGVVVAVRTYHRTLTR